MHDHIWKSSWRLSGEAIASLGGEMCDINWDANFGLKQNINFGKADPLTT